MKALVVHTVCVALAACVSTASAGTMFFAGRFDAEKEFVINPEAKQPCFSTRYCTSTIDIRNNKSEIVVEESVTGKTDEKLSCTGIIPLPVGVDVKSISLELVNGESVTDVISEYRSGETAGKLLQAIVKSTEQSALLAFTGQPILLSPQFELTPEARKIRLTYREDTVFQQGLTIFSCPMPSDHLAASATERTSVTMTIHNDLPLRTLFSPSHECSITRDGLHDATVRMTTDKPANGEDFEVCCVAAKDEMGLRILTHRPDPEKDGFFLLLGNPSGVAGAEEKIPKDILFVLDTSGSMRGTKMEQAQAAIEYCLDNLNPGDRFNIVSFSSAVKKFNNDLVDWTDDSREKGKVFIDELIPSGRTNIGDALKAGVVGKTSGSRPRVMIFLTDGTPTAGERVPAKILEGMTELVKSETQIFVMGVGHDVNAHLLDSIAELTSGGSEYVDPDDEIDVKVAGLFNRINNPFLRDVEIDFGKLAVHSTFPKELPALFRGNDLMVAGRYSGSGEHTVAIKGQLRGRPRTYECAVKFPGDISKEYAFLGPLWAARNIGFYLEEIRLHGEKDELVSAIVKLSHEFGILTEYTSFLADASAAEMSYEETKQEAKRRMNDANRVQSGKWAFNQAKNDSDLKNRKAVGDNANVYINRQGEVQQAQNIKQIDGTAYYERNGRWVEAEAINRGDKAKVREVRKYSDEYFSLIENNRKFQRAQALGGVMTVQIDNETVVVR